jgi:hypothetical protein
MGIITRLIVGLRLATAILQSSEALAASFILTTDPEKTCTAIEIDGEIQSGDYDIFRETLKKATDQAPLRRLYLNSSGGKLGTALAITDVIRNTTPTIDTIVQSRQRCNSACLLFLTIGSRRVVSVGAQIILHQAFDERTGKQDPEATKRFGQYLALNGMTPDVMWTMDNLKPGEQLTVVPSNAKRLGFGSFKYYGGTNPPATPQCSWDGFILKDP